MAGQLEHLAVVVGGGPAGVVAAMMLCRRGWRVKVHERRKAPRNFGDAVRSYAIVLFPRGLNVARAEGISFAAQEAVDFQAIYSQNPDGSIVPGRPANTQRSNKILFEGRQALAETIVSEAERLWGGPGGRLTFHWESTLKAADLEERVAHFVSPTGTQSAERYDLLVGADGASSAVRDTLVAKVPGFTYQKYMMPRRSRLFHRLADTGFKHCGDNSQRPTQSVHFFMLPGVPLGLLVLRRNADNTISGGITVADHVMHQYDTEEALYGLLAPFSVMPEDAKRAAARAMLDCPWSLAGATVRCSQLHGPRVVLIGDAGHSVTPALGQGANAAIEDTKILEQVLDEGEGDLNALPALWNRRRGPDAKALTALDRDAPYLQGLYGKRNIKFLTLAAHLMIGGALHKLLPGLFGKPLYMRMMDENPPPYSRIQRRMRTDFALAATAAVGAVALAALGFTTAASVIL